MSWTDALAVGIARYYLWAMPTPAQPPTWTWELYEAAMTIVRRRRYL